DQGRLPVVRGLALSRDDLLRRTVIMALMCRGRIEFDAIGEAHAIDFRRYFATEFAALGPLVAQGLVRLSDHDLVVTEQGWFLVRAVAMVFDRYCSANRARFSRVV
ncbi:MAG: coproporphyrinogen III oxidase, partial [Variovorax sp.]